jgi:uncharacterized NAD-dependent epimerase/dehydratase family protein
MLKAKKNLRHMYYSQKSKLVIYAQNGLGQGHTKTAEGVLRYGKNPIVAVIDKSSVGKTVKEVTGIEIDVPIIASVEESLKFAPDAMLLGGAWAGGQIPSDWRLDIIHAVKSGLDIINGLHDFLANDKEIAQLALNNNVKLLDVRRPPNIFKVALGKVLDLPCYTVATVGSDASVGKMTTSLELLKSANKKNYKSKFIATGQTGIMIEGDGIAIDRVISDFAAGAVEHLIVENSQHQFVFVEGQGSLIHPGYSGVTLSILHGACPNALILCHKANKTKLSDGDFTIPKLSHLVDLYQNMAQYMRPAKVVGIALNTRSLSEASAQEQIKTIEAETKLPTDDPVRYGGDKLFAAILHNKEK